MQGKPIYLEKNNIVLETVYDADKKVYCTTEELKKPRKKFRLKLFNRKNVKTR